MRNRSGLSAAISHITALKEQSATSALAFRLINDAFGELAAIIVCTLISHGRLSLPQLSRRAEIPEIIAAQTLVSLIQHQLVLHWTEINGTESVTFYSTNEQAVFHLLYPGEILSMVAQKYPEMPYVGEIVKNVLSYRMLRVADYLAAEGSEGSEGSEASEGSEGTEGTGGNSAPQTKQREIRAAFARLLADKLLLPVPQHEFHPLDDLYEQEFQRALRKLPRDSATSEKKRSDEAATMAKFEITKLFEPPEMNTKSDHGSAMSFGNSGVSAFVSGNGFNASNDTIGFPACVTDTTPLRFNYDRFLVHLRSEALRDFACHHFGPVTAKVYRAALAVVEPKCPAPRDPLAGLGAEKTDLAAVQQVKDELAKYELSDGLAIRAATVAQELQRMFPDLDLRNTIVLSARDGMAFFENYTLPSQRKRVGGSDVGSGLGSVNSAEKRRKTDTGTGFVFQPHPDDMADNDMTMTSDSTKSNSNITAELVAEHLKLLAGSSVPFLTSTSLLGTSFHIEFSQLVPALQKHIYDTILKTCLSPLAFRVLRIVREESLIDEKTLANLALIRGADARSVVLELVRWNALEIQEVPRTNDRNPMRSLFFYRHRKDVAYAVMGQCLLQNVSEVLEKAATERSNLAQLLSKCDRADVKGREAEMLSALELEDLRKLRTRETALVTQMGRLVRLWCVFGQY